MAREVLSKKMSNKGPCKFNDEWLIVPEYKEWIAKDPKGDVRTARCTATVNMLQVNQDWFHG